MTASGDPPPPPMADYTLEVSAMDGTPVTVVLCQVAADVVGDQAGVIRAEHLTLLQHPQS